MQDLVRNEFGSELNQLQDFAELLRHRGLVAPLNAHDWATVARGYNGAGFSRNHYDANLAAAYARRTSRP